MNTETCLCCGNPGEGEAINGFHCCRGCINSGDASVITMEVEGAGVMEAWNLARMAGR